MPSPSPDRHDLDPDPGAHAGPGPCVLYVEDQPLNALLMQAMFRARPRLRLVIADCGEAALRLGERLRPSLLLLDLRLPDVCGTALLPMLRERHGWASVPAMLVTSEAGFAIGASGFEELWAKPLEVQRTLARLDRWLAAPVPVPQLQA